MPYKDPEIAKQKSAERYERWSKKYPEKANARMRDWRHRNPKYMLRVSAERRAKSKNIEFDLTLEDMPDIPTICPIALIPVFPRNDGSKGPCDNSPTLDRIDPHGGYVKGNVRVLSHRGNRWKGEMTIKEVERLLAYMRNEI